MIWWWPRKKQPPTDPSLHVKLRPPAGFGDHLMLSAVVEGLKAERPELYIEILARHPELFRHNPNVDHVVYLPHAKKRNPEQVEQYVYTTHRPPTERYLQVTGHLIEDMYRVVGVPLKKHPRQPRIYLTDAELKWRSGELERLPRPRIAVVPQGKSSVRLPNKIYPADQWEPLGRLLVQEAGTVLHLGARKDGDLVSGARDYRDIGYRRTAALLRHCDLLVTHVGGIMHLAAALRIPTVVLYGAAEHPSISGYPWNRNLYTPIECGPCWMEEPCSHISCMRRLTPQIVVEEVRAALREGVPLDEGFKNIALERGIRDP